MPTQDEIKRAAQLLQAELQANAPAIAAILNDHSPGAACRVMGECALCNHPVHCCDDGTTRRGIPFLHVDCVIAEHELQVAERERGY
jgi:hypothetical protein